MDRDHGSPLPKWAADEIDDLRKVIRSTKRALDEGFRMNAYNFLKKAVEKMDGDG